MPQVKQFRFLGVVLTIDGNVDHETVAEAGVLVLEDHGKAQADHEKKAYK